MDLKVIDTPLRLNLFGFSAIAETKDYAGTAFKLMDRLWQTVKSENLKNNGLNIWVFDNNHTVFAGVELVDYKNQATGLELKRVNLIKYAYFKHVGPYRLLTHARQNINLQLKSEGYKTVLPHIEIYGHWSANETKLETEILLSLK